MPRKFACSLSKTYSHRRNAQNKRKPKPEAELCDECSNGYQRGYADGLAAGRRGV